MSKPIDNVNHKAKPVTEDVLELVHSVMHGYRSLQYRFLRDGPHDITHMDGKVLAFFAHQPDATQSALAQHSGRDKAQLARLIKGLRDKGLLMAQEDADDRRHVRLSLTPEGRAVHRALQLQARRLGERAVTGLNASEQRQLAALLGRVRGNLSEPD